MASEQDLFANYTEVEDEQHDLRIAQTPSDKPRNGAIGGAFIGGLLGIILALGFGMPNFDTSFPWGAILVWALGGTFAGGLVGLTTGQVSKQLEN